MLHVFNHALDQRLAERNLPPSVTRSLQTQRTKLAAVAIPEDQDPATQQLIRRAIDESFVSGFRVVMLIGAALAIASAATALIFIGGTREATK
jgi:DNA-binding LacI/PurR family transcriptional regulator